MSEIDDIVGEFLVESAENLDRYDDELLKLEREPDDSAALDSAFRTVHTIKGTCGFFEFDRLGSVAHAAETLLDRVRQGDVPVTRELTDALLATGDALRELLDTIARTGAEGDADHVTLIARLEALQVSQARPTRPDAEPARRGSEPAQRGESRLGELLVAQGAADPSDVGLALHSQELGDRRPLGEILVERGATTTEAVDAALAQQASVRASTADRSIRVDVDLLDELMNLVSELVLARNRISQLVSQQPESPFAFSSQRLDTITTELQERAMKTRMQPISTVSSKLPRLVRDVSRACGKQVALEVHGEDTELDRNVLEAVRDPLTHLVRNSIDHGLELPEEREAAGKAAEGRLTLRAYHEGGMVHLEVSDDGAGLDVQRITARAVERRIVTADEASALTRREALDLVFEPGFSTAAEVTEVSGRGVGLDVVRTNVERIGGTVEVVTRRGTGTTFAITIPLTLAIVPALVVLSGGERYAIPQLSLLELLRIEGGAAHGLEWVEDTPVYRLRGRLVPVVSLAAELGGEPGSHEEADALNIVVLQADGQEFGLIVDGVADTEEIVVKPLGSHLDEVALFAGATIMGDGRVALILDVLGLAQQSQVVTGARERVDRAREATEVGFDGKCRTALLAQVGGDHRVAIALHEVARLETFDPASVELSGGRSVVQHRGEIVPLVELADLLGCEPAPRGGAPLDVVMHRHDGHHVGLVVERVIDIVEHAVAPEEGGTVPASIVLDGRVTDLVDVATLLGSTTLPATPRTASLPPTAPAIAPGGSS